MPRTSKPWQTPQVLFNPQVYRGMQRGINILVDAIRPTLGPLPRLVANHNEGTNRPETLDNGAIIARRIYQLGDRQADVGAMYLRHLLWRLHETVGDGTATAAVLFQAIYNDGVRYIAADGNPVRLRRHLENGARLLSDLLSERAYPISGQQAITRLAQTICYDQELSEALGEIFDIIGPFGRLELRAGHDLQPRRQYVEGSYWDGAIHSPTMITDQVLRRGALEDAAILLSNLPIQEPRDLLPAMEAALASGARSLLLVVKEIPAAAISVLLAPANRERLLVVAAHTPGADINRTREALDDLAALTGARPLLSEAGDTLTNVQPEQLGRARRAWADGEFLGVSNGAGDAIALRQHVAALRAAFTHAEDPRDRKRISDRIGKLLGGAAVLWIGATGPAEIEQRKEQATSAVEALRGALRDGVLPGGGIALLDCRAAIKERIANATDHDERVAYNILHRALEAPTRALCTNAGLDASTTLARVNDAGPGYGFDVVRKEIVDMAAAGIVDSASVLRAALTGAIHHAALALSIDVLVHRANPREAANTP